MESPLSTLTLMHLIMGSDYWRRGRTVARLCHPLSCPLPGVLSRTSVAARGPPVRSITDGSAPTAIAPARTDLSAAQVRGGDSTPTHMSSSRGTGWGNPSTLHVGPTYNPRTRVKGDTSMRQGYVVVDGDGHMMEPHDIWRDYVDRGFRDRVPNVIGDIGRQKHTYGPSEIHPEGFNQLPFAAQRFDTLGREKYGEAFESYWDLKTRLRDMDSEGIDMMVGFPTSGTVATFPGVAPDLQVALCRAYNNWASDFCADSGGRMKFMAQICVLEPDRAASEVRRIQDRREVAGVMVNDPTFERLWGSKEYDGLWASLCDSGLAVGFHGSVSQQFLFRPWTRAGGYATAVAHTLSFPLEAMACLAGVILGGVLERHPQLRVGLYESNAGWIPWFLGRLDMHDSGRQNHYTDNALGDAPSVYFKRQCAVACDSDEATLPAVVDALGAANIIWNSDYPHIDAQFPGSVDTFLARPLGDDAKRMILRDNAVALYGERLRET